MGILYFTPYYNGIIIIQSFNAILSTKCSYDLNKQYFMEIRRFCQSSRVIIIIIKPFLIRTIPIAYFETCGLASAFPPSLVTGAVMELFMTIRETMKRYATY